MLLLRLSFRPVGEILKTESIRKALRSLASLGMTNDAEWLQKEWQIALTSDKKINLILK